MLEVQTEEDLRHYYEIPDGAIPSSVFEGNRAEELAERVISHDSTGISGEVHIIFGRNGKHVRRIAYLTAEKLQRSGVSLFMVYPDSQDSLVDIGSKSHPVFILDEEQFKFDVPEETAFSPETITSFMNELDDKLKGNYNLLLSLGQETYERGFSELIKSNIGQDLVSDDRWESEPEEERYDNPAISGALLFPAFSFLMMPVSQYFIYLENNDSALYSANFFLGSVVPGILIFGPVIVTTVGLVLLALFSKDLMGKDRKILRFGIFLLTLEALIPVALFLTNQLHLSYHASSVPYFGMVTSTSILSLLFQIIALISFAIILYPLARRAQKAFLIPSFSVGLAYLLFTFFSYTNTFNIIYPGLGLPTLVLNPYVIPYNSISFGFAFGMFDELGGFVTILSFASQWLLCAVYLWTSLSIRNKPVSFTDSDEESGSENQFTD